MEVLGLVVVVAVLALVGGMVTDQPAVGAVAKVLALFGAVWIIGRLVQAGF